MFTTPDLASTAAPSAERYATGLLPLAMPLRQVPAGYADYVEQLHPRLVDGGLVLLDNTLRQGRVVAPETDDDRAVVALNAALAADPRWETVLLPVSDGLTLLRKR